jgi:phospholipid-binding lipoprotein MlaA
MAITWTTSRWRGATRSTLAASLAALLFTGCAAEGARSDYDPLETCNRKIFAFNLKAQKYALDPIAKGWHAVMPDAAERAIKRFFNNLGFPIDFLNNVLQGKLRSAALQSARFVVNSTVGIAGLFDPATAWGLEDYPEDFGQTLAVWGMAPGPYLMLPLWGPSNVRELGGLAGDYYGSLQPWLLDPVVRNGLYATQTVNDEALDLEPAKKRRAAALDYYVFVRDAYFQRRQAQIQDRRVMDPFEVRDLYEVDEEPRQ